MGYQKFEYGFEANLSYIDNTMGILSASHIGNVGDLVNAIDNEEPLIIDDFSYAINSPKQVVHYKITKILIISALFPSTSFVIFLRINKVIIIANTKISC